ncbi:MAG TPA: peroxiredoxin family protein [Gemmatimonadales bacterium]|nr:peroxiredoxin family protein [Gemmatimonadales bacterium]
MHRSTPLATLRCTLALALLAAAGCATATSSAERSVAEQSGYTPAAFVSGGPEPGRAAPDFNLPWASRDTAGGPDDPYGLWKDRGKVIVLAFYPHDFTHTDSLELATFRDRYDDLFGPDVIVAGVSVDPLATHARFARTLELPFRLLSDPDQAVARRYGSSDTGGIDRRTVFVIGRDGMVVWRAMKFKATDPKAYNELQQAVRAARRG